VATHAPARLTRRRRAELLHGIYIILNEEPRMLELARAVLAAGVRIVQYRAKGGIVPEHVRTLRALTRERDALLVMNDDWRAAEEFDCDGVHFGPGDAGFERVAPVRVALPERLIGLSCGTLDEVRAANASDVDYLGVGSVYATTSKADAGAPIGTQALGALAKAAAWPVAAVGGITAASLPEVRRSGAAMAALISAVACAAQPQRAAQQLVDTWNRCGAAEAAP
jgi:thiamine-phosphate pyrophosphorylase